MKGELIRDAVRTFEIDLRGLTVFTEAATGPFACTAALALEGGAARVIALARDSRFGSRDEAIRDVTEIAKQLGKTEQLEFVNDRTRIREADIVTNTGHVRPFTRDIIQQLKPGAVIPLMWETWEHRPHELDLGACIEHDVMVLGTNEWEPRLRTLENIGKMAMKFVNDASLDVRGKNVVIVGGAEFGTSTVRALVEAGANVHVVSPDKLEGEFDTLRSDSREALLKRFDFATCDLIIVADYRTETVVVGDGGFIEISDCAKAKPPIVVIGGWVDAPALRTAGLTLMPREVPNEPRRMSVTVAHLGDGPVVDLHAAGVRIAQVMFYARKQAKSLKEARAIALREPLCQDFSPIQYARAAAPQG